MFECNVNLIFSDGYSSILHTNGFSLKNGHAYVSLLFVIFIQILSFLRSVDSSNHDKFKNTIEVACHFCGIKAAIALKTSLGCL